MAIVPDLSGTRPGRTGNVPIKDPRNRSVKERMANEDDCYGTQTIVALNAGNQLVVSADPTRNALLFMIPEGAQTAYVSSLVMTAPAGVPVAGGVGFELKGKAAESAYYAWSTSGGINLTVWVG